MTVFMKIEAFLKLGTKSGLTGGTGFLTFLEIFFWLVSTEF